MFDEANLYENVNEDAFDAQPQQGQHPNEQHVPALPAPQGTQIPVDGGSAFGPGYTHEAPQQPPAPPNGAAIIPTGDNGMYQNGYYPTGQIEPEDVTPEAAARSAGLTALFVVASVGAGVAVGGWKGGVAGLLLSGAVANGYRASKNWGSQLPDQKHEAVVSSVFAVAGVGLGAYAAYKAYEGREDDEEGVVE